MNLPKRVKWGLLGCGFLGANGLAIPALNNNLFSSSISLDILPAGGAFTNLINFSTNSESTPKSKLEFPKSQKKESSLDLSNLLSSPESKLSLELSKSQEDSQLPLTELFEENLDTSNSISGIYSAINLENRVKSVEEEMQRQYTSLVNKELETSKEKQNEHLQRYSEAKSKLKASSRSRRSVAPSHTLSKEQRSSIRRMYSLYHSLRDASKILNLRLRNEVPNLDIPVALPQNSSQSLSRKDARSNEKFLETIRWESPSIRTQRDMRAKRFYREDSWGPWYANPFKPFYPSEQVFKEDIRLLQSNARQANQMQQELEREGSRMVSRFRTPSLRTLLEKQYEEKKKLIASLSASSDSHIVNRVASYLLRTMNQI